MTPDESTPQETPQDLLAAADTLLTDPPPGLARCWQRACAALLRIALEQVLDGFWQRHSPGTTTRSMRTQLLVLPELAGPEPAELARRAWNGLSRAMHHHTYELPPTVAELRGWHNDVAALQTMNEPH